MAAASRSPVRTSWTATNRSRRSSRSWLTAISMQSRRAHCSSTSAARTPAFRSIRHRTIRTCAPATATACSSATGAKGSGQLFIWDSQWQRILVYNKTDGTYVAQYLATPGAPAFADITGMYIIDRGVTQPPILVWSRPDGLYQVPLTAAPAPSASPGASGLTSFPPSTLPPVTAPPGASQSPGPVVSGGSLPPSTEPTERPRRTPRAARAHRPRPAPDRE